MDRRKFFRMFTAGSVGLTAASKLALAEDLAKWMLSPQKTIFIPAPPKLVVPKYDLKHYVIELKWQEDPWKPNLHDVVAKIKQQDGVWVKV